MNGTILCGVTAGPSAAAAELAAALGGRLGLRLVVAHVVDEVTAGMEDSLTARQSRSGGERVLREAALGLSPETPVELRLVAGEPAQQLARLAVAEEADAIVLGSRRRGLRGDQFGCRLAAELEAALEAELGSEPAPPVLVAPPGTRRRSGERLAAAAG